MKWRWIAGKLSEIVLSLSVYCVCPHCGTHHDRDANAATNIRSEGIRIIKADGIQTGSTTIPTDIAESFFNDISADYLSWQPSPYPYCAKNSFTPYLYVQYSNQISADLDCSTNDPDTQQLVKYVDSITDAVINDPPAVPEPNTSLAVLPFGALVGC